MDYYYYYYYYYILSRIISLFRARYVTRIHKCCGIFVAFLNRDINKHQMALALIHLNNNN